MVDFGEAGRICLNGEIKGVCASCPWWEWDSEKQQCSNCQDPICHLHRERIISLGTP